MYLFCRLKLCSTKIGIRLCVSLLDKMVELYDAEEPSDGARAFDIGSSLPQA
jgi:ataxin-10